MHEVKGFSHHNSIYSLGFLDNVILIRHLGLLGKPRPHKHTTWTQVELLGL